MSYSERDYVNEGYDMDDGDDVDIECQSCGCVLESKPTGFEMVRDKVIRVDGYGAPVEWSWQNEPVWKCTNCDYKNSLDEVSR